MKLIQNMEINELLPLKFYLSQNYPNPFKEKTIIKYCLAYKTRVIITVFNSKNEIIDKLVDEEKDAGTYEVEFNSYVKQTGENRNLAEGKYYYKIKAGNYTSEKKMVILKD